MSQKMLHREKGEFTEYHGEKKGNYKDEGVEN